MVPGGNKNRRTHCDTNEGEMRDTAFFLIYFDGEAHSRNFYIFFRVVSIGTFWNDGILLKMLLPLTDFLIPYLDNNCRSKNSLSALVIFMHQINVQEQLVIIITVITITSFLWNLLFLFCGLTLYDHPPTVSSNRFFLFIPKSGQVLHTFPLDLLWYSYKHNTVYKYKLVPALYTPWHNEFLAELT